MCVIRLVRVITHFLRNGAGLGLIGKSCIIRNKSQYKLNEASQLVDLLYAPAPPIEGPSAVDWACTRIIAVSGLLRHLDAQGAEVFATQLVFRQLAESNDIIVGRNVRTLNGLRRVMQEVLEEAEEIGYLREVLFENWTSSELLVAYLFYAGSKMSQKLSKNDRLVWFLATRMRVSLVLFLIRDKTGIPPSD
ncbi:hypothetical protein GE061_016964 [Apolygus lucorum]|uniref:Uncharacterized protein n=1 Tax=Apolygus lucorum TaxID=248454 RepID=A0A8S9XKC1_APOLU|nr:hypothetical protein GE061_016964 [Apolygus lucorum]